MGNAAFTGEGPHYLSAGCWTPPLLLPPEVILPEDLQHTLQVHQASKQLKELLASIEGLQFTRFIAESELLVPAEVLGDMYRIAVQPFSRVSISAPQDEVEGWLRACLARMKVYDHCYLKIGDLADAPWTEAHLTASGGWLVALWNRLMNHELVILSLEQATLLGFFEEEYHYEAHLRTFGDSPNDVEDADRDLSGDGA